MKKIIFLVNFLFGYIVSQDNEWQSKLVSAKYQLEKMKADLDTIEGSSINGYYTVDQVNNMRMISKNIEDKKR